MDPCARWGRELVISHRLQDPNPIDGFADCGIDAVGEFWFDSRQDVARFFSNPDYDSFIRPSELALADVNAMRAIVAKMRVVHDEFSFQPSPTQPIPFDRQE